MSLVNTLYCKVCTFPVDFCDYNKKATKCKKWLSENYPEKFQELYADKEEIDNKDDDSVDVKAKKVEESLKKMELRQEKKEKKELENQQNSKIIIKTIERTKRKRSIEIQGLEVFPLDLKKLSKKFSNKFATGCSIVDKKLVLQGDLADDVEVFINKLLKEEAGLDDIKVEKTVAKRKKTEEELAADAAAAIANGTSTAKYVKGSELKKE
ncbi:hypothetical protein QEN19_001605 [Hanseniaspora menglaensis]